MTIENELPFRNMQFIHRDISSCKAASNGRAKMELGLNLGSMIDACHENETFEYQPRSYLGSDPNDLIVDPTSPTFNRMLEMYEKFNIHVPGSKRSRKWFKGRSIDSTPVDAESEKTPKWAPRLRGTDVLSAPSSPCIGTHFTPRSKSRSFTTSSTYPESDVQSPRFKSRPKSRSFYFAGENSENDFPKPLRLRSKSQSVLASEATVEEGDVSPRSRAFSLMVNRIKKSIRKPKSMESLAGHRLIPESLGSAKKDGSMPVEAGINGYALQEQKISSESPSTPALAKGFESLSHAAPRKQVAGVDAIPRRSSDEVLPRLDPPNMSLPLVRAEDDIRNDRVYFSADSFTGAGCRIVESTTQPRTRRASYSIFPTPSLDTTHGDDVDRKEDRLRQRGLSPVVFASMANIRSTYEVRRVAALPGRMRSGTIL